MLQGSNNRRRVSKSVGEYSQAAMTRRVEYEQLRPKEGRVGCSTPEGEVLRACGDATHKGRDKELGRGTTSRLGCNDRKRRGRRGEEIGKVETHAEMLCGYGRARELAAGARAWAVMPMLIEEEAAGLLVVVMQKREEFVGVGALRELANDDDVFVAGSLVESGERRKEEEERHVME